MDIGKEIRLSMILRSGRGLIVALDHGLPLGPMPGIMDVSQTLGQIVEARPDGVLLTPGQARSCKRHLLGKDSPALLLRLDWTNMFRNQPAPEGYAPIRKVRDAVKFGACGVVTYLFYGYENGEMQSLNMREVARTARECEGYGVPLVVEAMARGKLVKTREVDPEVLKIPVRMAAEIGADIIKTDYTGDPDSFSEITRCSPVPVMIAGGPKMGSPQAALRAVSDALKAGAVGVFFGRNIFQAPSPLLMVRALRALIHEDADLDAALRIVEQQT